MSVRVRAARGQSARKCLVKNWSKFGIGRHELRLGFANGATVSIIVAVRILGTANTFGDYVDFPNHGTEICQFINQSVVELTGDDANMLSIEFIDAQRLEVVKSHDGFESYTIEYDGKKFCD